MEQANLYARELATALGSTYIVSRCHLRDNIMQAKITHGGKTLHTSQLVLPTSNVRVAVYDAAERIKISFDDA